MNGFEGDSVSYCVHHSRGWVVESHEMRETFGGSDGH